jgi:hypothetical protein
MGHDDSYLATDVTVLAAAGAVAAGWLVDAGGTFGKYNGPFCPQPASSKPHNTVAQIW